MTKIPSVDHSLEKMLSDDNARMRKAGSNLAMASMRVVRDYDGIHRLSLAIADWSRAVADEGNRALTPPTK